VDTLSEWAQALHPDTVQGEVSWSNADRIVGVRITAERGTSENPESGMLPKSPEKILPNQLTIH